MPTAFIAIGSNDSPAHHIAIARNALAAESTWHIQAESPIYRSPAVATQDDSTPSSDYYNGVVALDTQLSAFELRRRLRALEAALGRDRSTPHKVAIDLDLVAIDREIMDVDSHHLPAPAITRHAFVAVPFADVAPKWVHPESGEAIIQIATKLRRLIELEIVSPCR